MKIRVGILSLGLCNTLVLSALTLPHSTSLLGQELELRVQRHSLHVGETVPCEVYVKDRDKIAKLWTEFELRWGCVAEFSYKPKSAGEQVLGPLEVHIGDRS